MVKPKYTPLQVKVSGKVIGVSLGLVFLDTGVSNPSVLPTESSRQTTRQNQDQSESIAQSAAWQGHESSWQPDPHDAIADVSSWTSSKQTNGPCFAQHHQKANYHHSSNHNQSEESRYRSWRQR